jgi:diacylglycerol kinase family enzyme
MTPFLLVNAGSGGGRAQGSILTAAKECDIPHQVVDPGDDLTAVLEKAVADGAQLLAAAGGDGTLSATADVAMAHDLPMVVVPAGTRNHFALDLGLDLVDPAAVLRASITHGHERRVDVGSVNGTTFLNNVSLGIYAAAVASDSYRDHKIRALLTAASQAASADQERSARISLDLPDTAVDGLGAGSHVVLISNNAYAPTFSPGARMRPRLDNGEVWVYVGGVDSGGSALSAVAHAVGAALSQQLLQVAHGAGRIVVRADRPDIPVAVDGELRPDLTAPLTFTSRSRAMRLVVPTDPTPERVDVRIAW